MDSNSVCPSCGRCPTCGHYTFQFKAPTWVGPLTFPYASGELGSASIPAPDGDNRLYNDDGSKNPIACF